MSEEKSLEGWTPEISDAATLAEVVDRAFDYRGDVTVVLQDGRELIGYLFNRNRDVAEPFVQMFEREGSGPSSVPFRVVIKQWSASPHAMSTMSFVNGPLIRAEVQVYPASTLLEMNPDCPAA